MSIQPDARPQQWVDVGVFDDLTPERGACVLVGGHQVALFRVDEDVYAIANRDPFSGANVLSRGIVGSKGAQLKVASPMYKQAFDLRSGHCIDDPDVRLATYDVRVSGDGRLEVAAP